MAIAALILAPALLVRARPIAPAPGHTVTVCVETGAGFGVVGEAQALASKIFAEAGVAVRWRSGLRGCPQDAIMVSLGQSTPNTLKPGALAYAAPYEGTHIRVFYDRINDTSDRSFVPRLLAHVLVHEIAHILQGSVRHGDTGIMKAAWDKNDYLMIGWKHLEFEPRDIDMINRGLAARAAGVSRKHVATSIPICF